MTATPQTLGRYIVERPLGEGGMGAVYLARDPTIGRQVAVKRLHVDSAEYRRRFKAEVTAAGSLRHPHIVTVFDSGEHEGSPFLAMEYIPGETLADKIERSEALSVAEKLRYIEELCEGLAHAHRAGIIHRDIKPANLIVDRDANSVKILDFGIARLADSNATHSGIITGTPKYMAPEQVAGRPVDRRTDIFAAGLVLYELLSYRRAFEGSYEDGLPYRIQHEEPAPLETLVPGLDRRVVAIVNRALKKNPDDRYQDASRMANDLRVARARLAPAAIDADGSTVLSRDEPRRRRVGAVAAAVAAALIIAAAWTSTVVFRRTPPRQEPAPPAAPATASRDVPLPSPPGAADAGSARGSDTSRSAATRLPPPAPGTPSPPVAEAAPDPREAERLKTVATAEELYRAGNGERTLMMVEAGLQKYPRDPDLTRVLRRLFGDAERRTELAEARASGALGARVGESKAFRLAESRRSQAQGATTIAELPVAIRALWSATDLFEVAAVERPPRAAGEEDRPPTEERRDRAPTSTPDAAKAAPPVPPPVASPAAEPPRSQAAAPPTAEEEREAVQRTLNELRSAYEALDIRRVLRVYPTLPSADALGRAFEDAREVRIGFSRPTIVLTGANTATASLNRTQEFVPKVGRGMPPDKRAVTYELRKDALGVWIITATR